ncbi:MAG: S8 family serine peptidase [Firmicutes bacterium]|nr:S8 family serine peptidase [Bacillota bacterium]MDY5530988.1 S8 family serine peptidase [Pumilibacteraceae bacterium]
MRNNGIVDDRLLPADGNGETECVIFAENYALARRALGKYRAKVIKSYPFIKAYGALVNVYSIEDLKSLPCIKSVCRAERVSVEALSKTNIARLTDFFGKKPIRRSRSRSAVEPARIAFIDTGFCPPLDFYLPQRRIAVFVDFVSGETVPYDDNGHGTAVGCLLAGDGRFSPGVKTGSAAGAQVVALKAIEGSGSGSVLCILEAMQWLFDNHRKYNVKTLCMSLGGGVTQDKDPLCEASKALWNEGITVVASAGNSGEKGVTSPGSCREIITVGSVEKSESGIVRAPYSSFDEDGYKPEICALGTGVECVSPSGEKVLLSGTSLAAPVIAGICHKIRLDNPFMTTDQVKKSLLLKAEFIGEKGTGYGYIDD